MSLQEKCRQIEQCNKMGIENDCMSDLFKEIREVTGSFNARCGAMKGSLGNVVTEDKEVKGIWQKYMEVLYRRDPNVRK